MLSENDRQNLLGNLVRNRVTLVTGAGFSCNALNVLGKNLPLGSQLAEAIWTYLYDTPYDGKTSLKSLYGAAINNPKGKAALRDFLRTHLHVTQYPDWYKLITRWFWRRIYTFNADDLVETVYRDVGTGLDVIVAPADYSERDAFLRSIQYVKLHGSALSDRDLTFGPQEYGIRAAARADIWYLHFVEDYSTMPTLFVGTELDEPIFWQYIEMRGTSPRGTPRLRRPKCFLINPSISKPNEDLLEKYNIVSIRQDARDFVEWLCEQQEGPTREGTLRLIDPDLEPALAAAERGEVAAVAAVTEYFLTVFRAPVRPSNPRLSAMFLLGAPPTWDDIANDIDAHREVNEDLVDTLLSAHKGGTPELIVVTSAAGGGKSTLIKRASLELVDRGYSVFFSDGTNRPDPARLAAYINRLTQRVFLFFDNAGDDFDQIADLCSLIRNHEQRPVIVLAARANDAARREHYLIRTGAALHRFRIPDLCDHDIREILRTLDAHDLLGALKKMSHAQQVEVFRTKARKQILVAMREATSGRGFDEILRDEFEKVEPTPAKTLYLISALASDRDYGLSEQQLITAMGLSPAETLQLLHYNLSGIMIQHERDASTYYIRHPAIANFVISSAPRDLLAEAVISLLISVSAVLPTGIQRRWSRAFRLYKTLLSHTRMHGLFPSDAALVRNVYEGIKDYFRDDGHYWLQYGSYEIEHGGNLDLAENYINQAEALYGSRQVDTARAHLLFRKAMAAPTAAAAGVFAQDALRILRSHMADSAKVSLHALHIFGSQMVEYIWRWLPAENRSAAFREVATELQRSSPDVFLREGSIERLLKEIKRAELETTVKK